MVAGSSTLASKSGQGSCDDLFTRGDDFASVRES
jgi:hypothetical protein